jgi:flagellar biosynthesis GTPase FlhF
LLLLLLLLLLQVNANDIYLVVNAGCREKDLEHIGKHLAAAKVRACCIIRYTALHA